MSFPTSPNDSTLTILQTYINSINTQLERTVKKTDLLESKFHEIDKQVSNLQVKAAMVGGVASFFVSIFMLFLSTWVNKNF